MKRIVGLLLAFLVFVGFGLLWIGNSGWTSKKFDLIYQFENVQQIPIISLSDVIDGNLANFFKLQDN